MNLFVDIGEKQIISIEIFSVGIFSTFPIPGAPALMRTSKPPWYDASTSPNPVLQLTSALCAICPIFVLSNLVSSAWSNAYDNDSATALLEPKPYPTGIEISCVISKNLSENSPSFRNSSNTYSEMSVLSDWYPCVEILKWDFWLSFDWIFTWVVTPCLIEKPAPIEPKFSKLFWTSSRWALKKPVTCAGQNAFASLIDLSLNFTQNIRIWIKLIKLV